MGRSSSLVGYGIGIAEVVGSNPTRSTFMTVLKYDSCNNKIKVLVSNGTAADKLDNLMDIDAFTVFSNTI
jgi:hypothetical protein